MFNNLGFLGTKALLFMDIVTVYFAVLPFLLFFSIYLAITKNYKKHYISQAIILFITIVMILVFEVGVRLTGGFTEYVKNSSISYDFLIIFLSLHIIIAITSTSAWLCQFLYSYKSYKNNNILSIKVKKHKKIGTLIFVALTVNSIMGVCIYFFLFIL